MQEQQETQNVKTWLAPQLIELGDIAKSTENGVGGLDDGIGGLSSS
jgi:hypothetical protein